ncbi:MULTISPECIES: DUF1294 domain-containing protein [unclassified Devosia]|uniref:DUF1294 domain-containing protein n=1 Tax=unclassified Devosia TaxID=196773 RepID=UPI00145E0020|nr:MULTISPECIES: DUF1294 domain-containing protein [unclassified Devosia]MBJ6987050.1 DUF1294 domain-containing protein [Devosia sp. MC521]QMW62674.1 DUF1294 domain-containing protein [Devosia sp. MC521]
MAKKQTSKFRYFCVAALLLALCFGLVTFRLPFWVAALYFGMGLVSLVLYAIDKSSARGGRRRIRELHLLFADTAFGILGGLLGQQLFRHKTQKQLFAVSALALTAFHLLVIFAVIEMTPGPVRSLN